MEEQNFFYCLIFSFLGREYTRVDGRCGRKGIHNVKLLKNQILKLCLKEHKQNIKIDNTSLHANDENLTRPPLDEELQAINIS